MRYYDTVLLDPALKPDLRDVLKSATVIQATNVVKYFYTGTSQEIWNAYDFPNVAPPFDCFWIEADAPAMIVSEAHGNLKWPAAFPKRWGMLFSAAILPKKPEPKWHVLALAWLQGSMYNIPNPAIAHEFGVNTDGSIFITENQKGGKVWHNYLGTAGMEKFMLSQPQITDAMWQVRTIAMHGCLFQSLLLAICFLHCRNVTTITHQPDVKESIRFYRKHGYHLTSYKTLVIDHMQSILQTEGDEKRLGLQHALHICRGHFKHFTEDKPMFGKLAGTFWSPQHLRGRPELGTVIKDYKVK